MTASQPPLFAPGWDLEPCTAADERAFLDLHGPPSRTPTGFDADPWHGYARPATGPRRRFNPYRGIHDVANTGSYL